MTRKHTRRKHYALVNTVAHVLEGLRVTPKDKLDKLRLRELSALDSFKFGRATVEDWKTTADLLNLTETMALSGIGPEALPACEAAQDALQQAHRRYQRHGKVAVSPPELHALEELYAWHDAQRTNIGMAEYEKAIKATIARVRNATDGEKVAL